MLDAIVKINKTKNIPIILIEQNAYMALKISYRGYVLETGEIKYQGKSEDLINSPDLKKAYLGEQ